MNSPIGLLTKRDFLGERGAEYQELIKGFDPNQLTPVGYDFRAGECINLTLGEKVKLTEGVKYRIRHGDFVIVVTRETLNLGTRDDIFGQVYSKVSFAIQGLSHVGTKIDPGFDGPLVLSFKNEGYDVIEFTKDTAICNVALQVISSTGSRYSPRSFEYPTLTERPNLPFPLTPEHWEKLSRWYSREAFDTYLQWSDKLSALQETTTRGQRDLESKLALRLDHESKALIDKLDQETDALESRLNDEDKRIDGIRSEWIAFRDDFGSKNTQFRNEVTAKIAHADQIYTGAVLTIFIATIAVIGVLISSAALFVNQLNVKVEGDGIFVSRIFLYVAGIFCLVFGVVVISAITLLLKKKEPKTA